MLMLSLIRHAKSSWSQNELSDLKRPLNKRGLNDAPRMAELARSLNFSPDLCLCSPAARARQTLDIFSSQLPHLGKKTRFEDIIYENSSDSILNLMLKQASNIKHLLLIGHNPSLTELMNLLSSDHIDNSATCSLTQLRFNCEQWNEIKNVSGILQLYVAPKCLSDFETTLVD